MEKNIKISTPDRLEINGILNSKNKSDKLLIFIHGFTGNLGEAHYYCAKEYFTNKGYDTYRFNLYTTGDNTRKMRDCSVEIHAQDIRTVAEYFGEYREISFIGHSLAGPCLGAVKSYPKNSNKIVFWDPAFEMKTTGEKFYTESNKILYQASGKHLEISQNMRDEFMEDTFLTVLNRQIFPKNHMFAIYADGDRHVDNKPQTDAMGIEGCIIEGANHGFTQEGKFTELFEKTLEYLEK